MPRQFSSIPAPPSLPSLPLCYSLHSPTFCPIDSSSYPLLFTHRALLKCEEVTGVDMLSFGISDPPAKIIRSLLYSSLFVAGFSDTIDQVGKQMTNMRKIAAYREMLLSAWMESMPTKAQTEQMEGVFRSSSSGSGSEEAVDETDEPFTWLDAWAAARYDFGLSDDQWLDSTPRQFHLLRWRRIQQFQREELMNGMLLVTLEAFSMNPPSKPSSPEDYMLHRFPPRRPQPVTGESIMAQLDKGGWRKANEGLKRQTQMQERITGILSSK